MFTNTSLEQSSTTIASSFSPINATGGKSQARGPPKEQMLPAALGAPHAYNNNNTTGVAPPQTPTGGQLQLDNSQHKSDNNNLITQHHQSHNTSFLQRDVVQLKREWDQHHNLQSELDSYVTAGDPTSLHSSLGYHSHNIPPLLHHHQASSHSQSLHHHQQQQGGPQHHLNDSSYPHQYSTNGSSAAFYSTCYANHLESPTTGLYTQTALNTSSCSSDLSASTHSAHTGQASPSSPSSESALFASHFLPEGLPSSRSTMLPEHNFYSFHPSNYPHHHPHTPLSMSQYPPNYGAAQSVSHAHFHSSPSLLARPSMVYPPSAAGQQSPPMSLDTPTSALYGAGFVSGGQDRFPAASSSYHQSLSNFLTSSGSTNLAMDHHQTVEGDEDCDLLVAASVTKKGGAGKAASANGKPKRKRVASVAQRRAANIRERRRMFSLNESFDNLRKKVPTFAYEKRLSRIETLRLAITYIAFMTDLLNGKSPSDIRLAAVRKNLISQMTEQHLLSTFVNAVSQKFSATTNTSMMGGGNAAEKEVVMATTGMMGRQDGQSPGAFMSSAGSSTSSEISLVTSCMAAASIPPYNHR